MMKVLIVEDERPIARAISRLVDQHPACTVAGTEANGQTALAFLRANPVDLVITDIQMPVMTGLQLLQTMQQEFPDCLAVVLSGYSEFEYARTALQCHAFDYLLKSVTKENLFRVLDRAAAVWQERNAARQRQQLELALAGEPVPPGERFYAALIPGVPASRAELCPGCHVFRREREQIVLSEEAVWNPEDVQRWFQKAVLETGRPVQVIYTQTPVEAALLRDTVRRLRQALDQQAPLFQPALLEEDCTRRPDTRTSSLTQLQPQRTAEAIRTQQTRDLRTQLDEILARAACRADVRDYLDAVLSDSRIAASIRPSQLQQAKAAIPEILDAASAEDCVNRLMQVLRTLQSEPAARRSQREIVEEIARQLETDYHLPYSAEALARQYNFVPGYLNRIFKQYKGVRPSEYLFNIRIERAKAMLKANPDVLVKDVAASVGYSDPHYFSNLFKRATGHWPTEYQQKQE